FGESKVGGGIKKRYNINPNIFYYSPETSLNFIGDLDNYKEDHFSSAQFQNFNSDFDKLTHHSTDFKSNESGRNFLASSQSTAVKNLFGAANLNQKLSKNWQMNLNGFNKRGTTRTHHNSITDYIGQEKTTEMRETKNHHRLFYTMNKARFKYDNLDDTEFLGDLIYKHSNGSGLDMIQSQTGSKEHFIRTQLNPKHTTFTGTASFNKRFDYKHLLTFNGAFDYQSIEYPHNWQFDEPIFNQLIPFKTQSGAYNFINIKDTQTRTVRI